MARDYANKNRFTKRPKPKQYRLATFVGLIFASVCITSGILIYVFHMHQQAMSQGKFASWFEHAKSLVSHKQKTPVKTASSKPVAPHEEIQFDFYTELPNMQVNLPASAQSKLVSMTEHKATQKTEKSPVAQESNLAGQIDDSIKTMMAQHALNKIKKPTTPMTQYVLQVGVFKDQVSASQLRLSLLLSGIETQIVKTGEHTYHIQRGPYSSERQAKSAQRLLSKKGFESSIKEI